MAIDKNPKVGRYLFADSFLRSGFFRPAGWITKISGTRISYNYKPHEDDETKTKYIYKNSLTAVCDTEAEIETIKAFDSRVVSEAYDLQAKHKREAERLFSE